MTSTPPALPLHPLSPAQRRAFDGLCAGIQTGRFSSVWGDPGRGVTLVLQHAHARFGGIFLGARDLFPMHLAHPLGLEEAFAKLLYSSLDKASIVFIDDLNLLLDVVNSSCSSPPRRGYADLLGQGIVDYLAKTAKRLVIGRGAGLAGIGQRVQSWRVREFAPEDYRTICTNVCGPETGARLDFARIFRAARQLDGHQLRECCMDLMRRKRAVTTEDFLRYLEDRELISNVDLAQVQPMKFEDLKGIDDLLQQLETHLITPLENDALALELSVRPKRGVLLAGPPGTGKTSIGRALAHRLKSRFFLIDGTFIAEAGNFYEAVNRVFAAATQNAPAVIFIDDTDVIFENGGATGLYRYLLTKLDGLESESNAHVCVMMTAMDVASMPPALIRSGRIELWLETRLPDEAGRAAILRDLAARGPEPFRKIHVNRLAAATEGLTGADLKRLFEDGKLLYAYDQSKGQPLREVSNYFMDAIEAVRHNKQRYAEAEKAARSRRPYRPPYYDPTERPVDDDEIPF